MFVEDELIQMLTPTVYKEGMPNALTGNLIFYNF